MSEYNPLKAALFRKELAALLKRYNAELEAEDHWRGYAECGEDVRMTVTFEGETINDEYQIYEDLDLGKYFTGDDE